MKRKLIGKWIGYIWTNLFCSKISLLIFYTILIFITTNLYARQAFKMRGYDLGQTSGLLSAIDAAAANGMNFITLSHDVCMDWYDIDSSFETYAQKATSQGMGIYFWNHVIERPPNKYIKGGVLQFDDPGLMNWLARFGKQGAYFVAINDYLV